MKTKTIKYLVVALWCVGLSLAPDASASEQIARSVDVALQSGGLLIGQVVNAEGQPFAKAEVVLKAGGNEIARCQTDNAGTFQVAGLKGGPVEVAAVGVAGTCRLWAPGTAPPAAQRGLLVVSADDVVRGQHMSGRGVRGHGGGLLALMIDHPVVTAGAIGAAIAIPIAVSNNGSPSSP
jgi:hypothetical protein